MRPPRPPHLATPVVFGDLELAHDEVLRLSKCDARCCFDQLMLPCGLKEWFGRPPITLGDLLRYTDTSLEELDALLPGVALLRGSDRLWPVSTSWPMGFSWSSFVAQSKLLKCCRDSGLTDEHMLADDLPSPQDTKF